MRFRDLYQVIDISVATLLDNDSDEFVLIISKDFYYVKVYKKKLQVKFSLFVHLEI